MLTMLLLHVLILAHWTSALIDNNNSTKNGSSTTSTHDSFSSESVGSSTSPPKESGSYFSSLSGSSSGLVGSYIQQGIQAWSTSSKATTSQASGKTTPSSDAIEGTLTDSQANTTAQSVSSTKLSGQDVSSVELSGSADRVINLSTLVSFSSTSVPNVKSSIGFSSAFDADITLNNASISPSTGVSSSTGLLNGTLTTAPNPAITRSASVAASLNSTNGTGLQLALDCYSQWNAYSNSEAATICYSTGFTTFVDTISFPDTLYDTYTLCDGVPRAVITNSTHEYSYQTVTFQEDGWFHYTATISSEVSITGLATATIGSAVLSTTVNPGSFAYTCGTLSAPITTPTCTIAPQYCSSVWDEYSTMVTKQTGNSSNSMNIPPCNPDISAGADPCADCALYVNSVQLIYFPVTIAGNFCGDYYTVTPNVSTPVTATAYGTTFTSGTAYIYYSGASAGGGAGTCGPVLSSGIFAVPSSSVSSYRFFAPGPTVTDEAEYAPLYSFNFADLPPNPVPAAAWSHQASCINNLGETPVDCSTITDANYAPLLNVLQFFTNLDPAWANCSYAGGVVDPPYALSQAGFAAAPAPSPTAPMTDSQSNPTASATPGSGPPPAHPSQTAPPVQTKGNPKPTQATHQPSDPPAQPESPVSSDDPSASNDPGAPETVSPQNPASPSLQQAPSNPASKIIGELGGGSSSNSLDAPAEPAPASNPASLIIAGLTQPATSENSPLSQNPSLAQDPAPAVNPVSPITTIGGLPVAKGTSGGVVIGGTSLDPGSSTFIDNTPVAVSSGAVVIGGGAPLTIPISKTAGSAITHIGGQPVSVDPNGGIIIGGSTLQAGSETTIDNTPVSVGASSIVVDGSTINAPPASPHVGATVASVGNQPIVAGTSGEVIVGAQTIRPGQATTIDGTQISAGSQGVVISNTPKTILVSGPNSVGVRSGGKSIVFTAGSQVVTGFEESGPSGTPIVVAGTLTLTEGGPAATISGTVLSADPSGVALGGQTIPFSSNTGGDAAADPTNGAILTIGSSILTAVEQSLPNGQQVVVLGSSTLTVGGSAQTINGEETISAGASGVEIVSDGQISMIPFSQEPAPTPAPALATEAVMTLGSSTVTAMEKPGNPDGPSIVVIGSQTLTVGGAPLTTDGETLSAATSGIVVVSNGHTATIPFSTTQIAPSATEAVLTLGSSLITAIEEPGGLGHPSIVVIDGHTLTVGGARLTTDGETIIAASTGLIIISVGRTSTVPFTTGPGTPLATEAVLTLGSSLVTATEYPAVSGRPAVVVVDGHTLTVGGAPITLDGETISAGSAGLVIVSGSRTITDPYSTVGATGGGSTAGPGGSGGGGAAAGTTQTAGGFKSIMNGVGFGGYGVLVLFVCIAVMIL